MYFDPDTTKASHLTVFVGARTYRIDLEKAFHRRNGLEDYVPRYEQQIFSLLQITDLLRQLSLAPNPKNGDFDENGIRLILFYMPELVDKLTTLLSIAHGTFSFRPAGPPDDIYNDVYFKAYNKILTKGDFNRFVFSAG